MCPLIKEVHVLFKEILYEIYGKSCKTVFTKPSSVFCLLKPYGFFNAGRRSLTNDDDFAILAGSHTLESNASNMFEQHRRHSSSDMLNLENSKISKEVVGTMGSIKAVGSWKKKTKESRGKYISRYSA